MLAAFGVDVPAFDRFAADETAFAGIKQIQLYPEYDNAKRAINDHKQALLEAAKTYAETHFPEEDAKTVLGAFEREASKLALFAYKPELLELQRRLEADLSHDGPVLPINQTRDRQEIRNADISDANPLEVFGLLAYAGPYLRGKERYVA